MDNLRLQHFANHGRHVFQLLTHFVADSCALSAAARILLRFGCQIVLDDFAFEMFGQLLSAAPATLVLFHNDRLFGMLRNTFCEWCVEWRVNLRQLASFFGLRVLRAMIHLHDRKMRKTRTLAQRSRCGSCRAQITRALPISIGLFAAAIRAFVAAKCPARMMLSLTQVLLKDR